MGRNQVIDAPLSAVLAQVRAFVDRDDASLELRRVFCVRVVKPAGHQASALMIEHRVERAAVERVVDVVRGTLLASLTMIITAQFSGLPCGCQPSARPASSRW